MEEKIRKIREEIKKMKELERNKKEDPINTYELLAGRLSDLATEHKKNLSSIRNQSIDVVDKLLEHISEMEK